MTYMEFNLSVSVFCRVGEMFKDLCLCGREKCCVCMCQMQGIILDVIMALVLCYRVLFVILLIWEIN